MRAWFPITCWLPAPRMATASTAAAPVRTSSLLSPIPARMAQAPTVNRRYLGKKYEYDPCEASHTAVPGRRRAQS